MSMPDGVQISHHACDCGVFPPLCYSTGVEFGCGFRHSGSMSTEKPRPPRVARRFNKAAVKIAGRRFLPVWALVKHRGRTSGKLYETPIAILGSTPESVYIALPWGGGTDWVRNLQAAG